MGAHRGHVPARRPGNGMRRRHGEGTRRSSLRPLPLWERAAQRFSKTDRVRGRRRTPHPASFVELTRLPSPTRGEGTSSRHGVLGTVVALAVAVAALAAGATNAAAQTKVRLAVGGQSALYYLPLTVTD